MVMEAMRNGVKIAFADETVFTKTTLPRKTYAVKGANVSVYQKDLGNVYRSALAAISTEGNVEHLMVVEKAINQNRFVSFLKKLRQKLGNEKICLFLDNLQVHKTKKVMEAYRVLDIQPIFSETYSPDLNPIETVFA